MFRLLTRGSIIKTLGSYLVLMSLMTFASMATPSDWAMVLGVPNGQEVKKFWLSHTT